MAMFVETTKKSTSWVGLDDLFIQIKDTEEAIGSQLENIFTKKARSK